MHKGNSGPVAIAVILIAVALPCRPQVLAPAEILDPAMRQLQQKYMPELKAAAVDITTHNYPYRFYLSRKLDVTEKQEQVTDQRSIRFAKFQDRTVLQVTGNYFASYSDETMNRNERVKRTYLDVVLPILRAHGAPPNEKQVDAFAIEVSHHVRKRVLGVTLENPENLAIIIPRRTAEKVAASSNENEQVTALLDSRVFIDGNPVTLWPQQGVPAAETTVAAASTPAVVNASAVLATTVPGGAGHCASTGARPVTGGAPVAADRVSRPHRSNCAGAGWRRTFRFVCATGSGCIPWWLLPSAVAHHQPHGTGRGVAVPSGGAGLRPAHLATHPPSGGQVAERSRVRRSCLQLYGADRECFTIGGVLLPIGRVAPVRKIRHYRPTTGQFRVRVD